jgi:hypothetical protein
MKAILILFGLLVMNVSYSQSPSEIQQWQSLHPGFLLMTVSNFEKLPLTLQEKLKDKVVFYTPESDQKIASISVDSSPKQSTDESALTQLKMWKVTHPDVKIVPRSVYLSATPEQQLSYTENHCLILIGEVITASDISNY